MRMCRRQVFLVFQQLDVRPLQAGVDIPVEAAQVVAAGVVTIVRELDAGAAPRRAPFALHGAGAGAL